MKIGTVKELLDKEYRVGLTPQTTLQYVESGHEVYIESNAGLNAGFTNEDYIKAGAQILNTAEDVWKTVDLLVKVKEPIPSEYQYFRKNLAVFSYLHLSSHRDLLDAFVKNNTTAIAYETVQLDNKKLPCLEPMSGIAGRVAVLEGSRFMQSAFNGPGKLISGTDGVDPATTVIIGAGNAGLGALELAVGLNSNVIMLDINESRLNQIKDKFKDKVEVLISIETNLIESLAKADLVISTVSLPGAKTPKIIKRSYYKNMKKGAVIVDIAIDQGGSTEVAKKMTLSDPVFVVDDIIHYAVPNMPSAVHQTSTIALTNSTVEFGLEIANNGLKDLSKLSNAVKRGINVHNGIITNENVAKAFNLEAKTII